MLSQQFWRNANIHVIPKHVLNVSQQFLEMRFRDHPVSVAVYTDHMNKSRATRMELKVVEGKLGDLEKQFSSMGGRVKKLEK